MFGLPPLLAHIAELLTITLLVGIATGVGLVMLRLLRVTPVLSLGERLLFGTMLGYGTMSLLVLAVGLLGLLYTPVVLVILVALAALGLPLLARTFWEAAPALRNAFNNLRYLPNLFLAIVIVLCVAASLTKALVPVATQDDLMYHLALPRRYVEQHAINFYPDSNYSLFPQIMEMLYTVGLLLGSDRISVLFAFTTGLLAAASAALFAKRLLAERDDGHPLWQSLPLLVAAIFLSTPLHGFIMRAANTDFAQATAEMLAIYAFYMAVMASPQINTRLLVLSGICGGLSFSVKYYGILLPGALGLALLAILFTRWRKGDPTVGKTIASNALRNVLAYGVPILVIGGVWLLRNFLASGNPVWPALGNILGGSYWSPAADPEVLLGTIPGLKWESIPSGLEYQYIATLGRKPLPIDNHIYVVSIGPLLITSLLALPFARWKAPLRLVLYSAAFVWVVSLFYFSRASIRYLATVFLLCALMGAYGLISLAVRSRIGALALGSVVALTLTLLTLDTTLSTRPFLSTTFALDRAAEDRYLDAHMDDYPIMQYLAVNAPSDSVVYDWDSRPRGYRIPHPYIYGRLVPKYSGVSPNPDEWHARLKALGITHVLVHNRDVFAPGYPPGYDPDREIFQALANRYFGPPLVTSGNFTLYELR
ncbi:MAG: hypothetical protein QOH93_2211 [Chloroflexia bacterium]|jgi:hypothetical protein|nr:hypothetical protein [Chloroflexia bacterium]